MSPDIFSFPDPSAIKQCLKRFNADRVQFFIWRAEEEADRWAWAARLQKQRDKIFDKVSGEEFRRMAYNFRIAANSLMGDSAKTSILINMMSIYDKWPDGMRPCDIVSILRELELMAGEIASDGGSEGGGGVYKMVEREMTREISRLYRTAFKRRPSASKGGIFYSLMQEISLQMGNVWGIAPPTFGAKLIASTITKQIPMWDYEDELLKTCQVEQLDIDGFF